MHIPDRTKRETAKTYRDVLWKPVVKYINKIFLTGETCPIPHKTRGCPCMFLQKSLKGSMAVEASLLVPAFFLALFALFYILQIMFGVQQVQEQLRDAAHQYACYGTKFSSIRMLIEEKKQLRWEETDGQEFCKVEYPVRVPVLGEKFFQLRLYQQIAVSRYAGSSMLPKGDAKEEVYITQTGRVCHKSKECTYLKPDIKVVSAEALERKRNVSGGKYYACERCSKGKKATDFFEIFITSYGESFHIDRQCSGLKRTIRKVKRNETGLPACSKCF